MRKFIIIAVFLIVIVGGATGLFFRHQIYNYLTSERYSPEQEKKDIATAEGLLKDSKPQEALDIIQKYQERFVQKGPIPRKWVDLFIKGSLAAGEPENIYFLYEQYPHAINGNEEAALIVADILIKSGKANDYLQLREQWKNKEGKPANWFVLDADKALVDGDRAAALKLLNSRSFEGADDVPRLVRLAFLSVDENPRLTWEYLTEAYQKDPKNAEVRSYRARLLEAVDRTALALSEYVAAASLDPKNPAMRDQLAEFYRRHGRYNLALKVWEDALEFPNADSIWIKAWFWSKVATPVDFKWSDKKIPPGELQPFVEYLVSLKSDQFWDTAKFEAIPNSNRYLQTEQATFWLRLIQQLKDGQQDKAWELILYNSFSPVSWNPELEEMLKRVLAYRRTGSLAFNEDTTKPNATNNPSKSASDIANQATKDASTSVVNSASTPPDDTTQKPAGLASIKNQHPFYLQIQELGAKADQPGAKVDIPPDLQKLMTGKDAFSACFLAGGWLEAALDLNTSKVLPEDAPEWLAYGLTQAIRYNRGTLPALEFATQQKPSPSLTMLTGELLISSGSPDAGLEKLITLVSRNDDVGFRSAWLVTLLYIERKQYEDAKKIIESHPRLANDIVGKEALARIALLEGKTEEADKQYSDLENDSWEAKSYLARKAFDNKDWQRAKELTEMLLQEFPNNTLIQQNYEKIIEQQAKENGPQGSTSPEQKPVQAQPLNTKGSQ